VGKQRLKNSVFLIATDIEFIAMVVTLADRGKVRKKKQSTLGTRGVNQKIKKCKPLCKQSVNLMFSTYMSVRMVNILNIFAEKMSKRSKL
jgi:hypothetical protein